MDEAVRILGDVSYYSYDEDGNETQECIADQHGRVDLEDICQKIADAVNHGAKFDV